MFLKYIKFHSFLLIAVTMKMTEVATISFLAFSD